MSMSSRVASLFQCLWIFITSFNRSLSLESDWLQVSSSYQNSSKYSNLSLHDFASPDFQFHHYLFQTFGDCSKGTIICHRSDSISFDNKQLFTYDILNLFPFPLSSLSLHSTAYLYYFLISHSSDIFFSLPSFLSFLFPFNISRDFSFVLQQCLKESHDIF